MTQKEYNNGVRLWADDVYRFAVRCGGGEELSKDAVQEAFASLWEKREQVEVEKGRSYLFAVVHNCLMSHHRHEQVHQQTLPLLEPERVVKPDEQFDIQEALHRALMRLPQVQREAVLLKDVEGYSCREIAEMLSLTEKQVSVYLFRARVSLKKTLIALGYDNNN
ncbi:MAG: sigma-70 family RNA polymerase sigma factor [Bacteroidales bacterium]|nr:sigma-70 family RNA polymerase sigma factor [Bacteroidales bacterium]MBR3413343.1 sigma-70 family RNA polymerase sigma factor [Bacteroidales bacterium]